MSGSTMHDGRSAWWKTVWWPRWRRPGQGRRAKQHTRIAVNDATWHQLQLDAINAHHTTGRWIGLQIEHWAGRGPSPCLKLHR